MVNPPLYVKLIATCLCSVIAIIFYLLNRQSKSRFFCMIAMLCCTVGDFFMTNTFQINDMLTTIIGALSFMIGHAFYAYMYYLLLNKNKKAVKNIGFYIGLIVGYLPLIIMEIMSICMVDNPPVLYLVAVPIYVAVITLHIVFNYSYSFKLKNWRSIILIFAVTLFYITDIWIFINMFKLIPDPVAALDLEHCIWHFYPIAQLLLIVFCE